MPGDKNYGDIKHKKENLIFFLGGYDAEMLTIRDILIDNNFKFYDKQLTWGAKLSDYKDELKKLKEDDTPVLIELTIDIDKPGNAKIIDHHNEYENNKSSLEQIAELLKIKLDRWQQLIAANDRGHISALKEICATENEIREIRKKDKDAQGVTEKDEKLAKESIEKFKTEKNHITVIKSLTDKFSPIIDLMYGKTDKLLIYNENSLLYIGNGKPNLVKKYKNLVDGHKTFYGGGKKGYFGILIENNNEETMKKLVDGVIEILNKEENEKIYSYHIFLFPFKWRHWDVGEKESLKDKFNVEAFRKKLDGSNWNRDEFKFTLEHFDHYNEYNYFYEYVREILYDLGDDLKTKQTENNDKLINHFEYKISKNETLFYNIKLCDSEATTYNLEIDSILLNVYQTGTAVLSFHLRNKKHKDKEDVLKINKFGRRLYVPFFDLEPDSIYTGEKDKTDINKVLSATKHNEIPDAIWIGENIKPDKKSSQYEDFEQYRKTEIFKCGPFLLPKFIEDLFPEKFFLTHEEKGYKDYKNDIKNENYKIYLRPVLDDRMHVVSWYGNSDLVNELNKIKECNDFDLGDSYLNDNRKDKNHYSYTTNDWWYNYIFSDTPEPMCKDKFMKEKLIKNNTYSRWIKWGTLFGMSRFSLVILTSSFSELEKNNASFLVRHLQSMYYKMAELCLLQRATVLSFSDEVTHVSNLIDKEDTKDQNLISKKIDSLYKHYILFVNKIYFREITAQEQGIEMYEMMQNIMRISNDVKDLDNEIDELNRYASMLDDKKETREMKRLTLLATFFLPLTLVAGILGMNTLPGTSKVSKYLFNGNLHWPLIISFLLMVLSVIVTFGLFKLYKKWKRL